MELAPFYQPVEDKIKEVKNRFHQIYSRADTYVKCYLSYALKYTGKFIRPCLLLHSASICGSITPLHIDLCVIIELIHRASLIHDDVLDEARVRHQRLTLNHKWGNRVAILTGDYLLSEIYRLSSNIKEKRVRVLLANTTNSICYGQLLQVSRRFSFNTDEKMYLRIISNKTASLFASACLLGAINNGVSWKLKSILLNFGKNFGVAFQMVDDCCDVFGEQGIEKKSLAIDLQNGESTLPVILLLKHLPAGEKTSFKKMLLSSISVKQKIKRIQELIIKYRVVQEIFNYIRRYTTRASQEIQKIQHPDKKYLFYILDYILHKAYNFAQK